MIAFSDTAFNLSSDASCIVNRLNSVLNNGNEMSSVSSFVSNTRLNCTIRRFTRSLCSIEVGLESENANILFTWVFKMSTRRSNSTFNWSYVYPESSNLAESLPARYFSFSAIVVLAIISVSSEESVSPAGCTRPFSVLNASIPPPVCSNCSGSTKRMAGDVSSP
ncbi:predicted protein [Meyerozyma guilliermondii ATCC 6260]|uniref:Uncharacterized protein n=1 Tax=Meyerozyma guilliermondii (strain ATCC 6260 / CBS 566 / DSM 6381 / JCM 1539 / NBRC 10279 / NRRL Y-324) TaxID=294746 RepID=A5DNS5_PICGU|nr:uncharacterized protein PGUG_04926 [Meyerozyma guilliermondii ATCC 6260]EDK40828.2 predicted protein [Meyerozyma guilliermondii ATCC 6260]